MAEETETQEAPAKRGAHGGAIPAKHPIKCGYKNCKFKSLYATVVGLHRSRSHGIKGKSITAGYMRRSKKPEGLCPQCGEGPFKALADHMRKVHGVFRSRRGRPAKQESNVNGNQSNYSNNNEEAIAFHVGQLTTRFTYDVEALAARLAIPAEDFAARCLAVLSRSSKALRERYGLSHSL